MFEVAKISREITWASASTICARIVVVSSKPLQIAQREFGVCFMGVYYTPHNGPSVSSVAGGKKRATMRMAMAMAMRGFMLA